MTPLLLLQDEVHQELGIPGIEGVVQQYAWLLLGAALVGMLARRINVPYAAALVIGGLLLEETHVTEVPSLDPGLLLFVFLPPLLFDAAFRLDARELRVILRPVLVLAVPGVLLTALVVGGILWLVVDTSFAVSLLFGSIVAATDPVAVIGIFQHLKVPARLGVVAEAESLINDGMAVTLYIVLLGLVIHGRADASDSIVLFGREVAGGILIGTVLGFVFSRLTGTIDDHLIEMILSAALAYGSYLLAQSVEASGPLACVAAGLIHGSYGRAVGMSERTTRLLDDLWEFLGFVANALVFLLLGFSVNIERLLGDAWPATVAVIAVLLARVLVISIAAATMPPHLEVI
ncbi:MAG TPA: cation:proton antiporter, partial [Thermomicrobiales bacterium]|nr:cation:proton antiporter [Thermomicrobiales bacterium]